MYLNSKISNKKGTLPAVLLILLSIACSLGAPFAAHNVIVAGVLLALTSTFAVVTAERRVTTALLLASTIFLFFTKEGIMLVSVLFSIVVGCGVFARALEKLRSPFLWAIPVVSFAIAAVVTKNLVTSMLALGFALPALALSATFSKKHARVGAICLISGSFLIGAVLFLLADIYSATGEINLAFFEEISNTYREAFTELLLQFETLNPKDQTTEAIFTALEAKNLASEIVSLFPAFFVIGCNAAAYFAQKLMYVLVRREGEEHKFEDKMIALIMSPYAGATFIISFFVMLAAGASTSHALAYTVSENIFYIFIPGLAASGIMFHVARIARFRRGGWVVLPFILLAFFNVGFAMLLAAGVGAYYSIANPLHAFLESKKDDDSLE